PAVAVLGVVGVTDAGRAGTWCRARGGGCGDKHGRRCGGGDARTPPGGAAHAVLLGGGTRGGMPRTRGASAAYLRWCSRAPRSSVRESPCLRYFFAVCAQAATLRVFSRPVKPSLGMYWSSAKSTSSSS